MTGQPQFHPRKLIEKLRLAAHGVEFRWGDEAERDEMPTRFIEFFDYVVARNGKVNGIRAYDGYFRRAICTREYAIYLLTAFYFPKCGMEEEPFALFRQMHGILNDWERDGPNAAFFPELRRQVKRDHEPFVRAEMVADLIVGICWQIMQAHEGLFPIPMCGQFAKTTGDLAAKDVTSNGFSLMPIEFPQANIVSNRAQVHQENPKFLVSEFPEAGSESERTHMFGWLPKFDPWRWVGVIAHEEGQDTIKKCNEFEEFDLVMFACFRDFFERRDCQIVGAYLRRGSDEETQNGGSDDSATYEYVSECGLIPNQYNQAHNGPPTWDWAKARYQRNYACRRRGQGAASNGLPPAYLTLSFSVPFGDLARQSRSGQAMPIYAVYITVDLLQLSDHRQHDLKNAAARLYESMDDLRIVATRQLGIESLESEMALRKETDAYKKAYEILSDEIHSLKTNLERVNHSLWRVQSIMTSEASLLYSRTSALAPLFKSSSTVTIGGVDVRTGHDGAPEGPNNYGHAYQDWCAAAFLFLTQRKQDEYDSIESHEKLRSVAAERFRKKDEFTTSIKKLFFSEFDEFPYANDDRAYNGELDSVFRRVKAVLHYPFKPSSKQHQHLSFIGILSAFPHGSWHDDLRADFEKRIAKGSECDNELGTASLALERTQDLMTFLAALWSFYEEESESSNASVNYRVNFDLEKATDKTILIVEVVGQYNLLKFLEDKTVALQDAVTAAVTAHCISGFVSVGSFAAPFYHLLSNTLPPDFRRAQKVISLREGELEHDGFKLAVGSKVIHIEYRESFLDIYFGRNKIEVTLGNKDPSQKLSGAN